MIMYGALVINTVSNSIHKEKLAEEMHALSTSVSALDYQYLELKNSITDELALDKGYVHVAETKFAYFDKTESGLSVNKN